MVSRHCAPGDVELGSLFGKMTSVSYYSGMVSRRCAPRNVVQGSFFGKMTSDINYTGMVFHQCAPCNALLDDHIQMTFDRSYTGVVSR